jgi:hypothetical protein
MAFLIEKNMLFEIDYIRFLKSKIFYLKKCKHAGLQNAPKRLKLNTRIFETAKFLLQTKFSKFSFNFFWELFVTWPFYILFGIRFSILLNAKHAYFKKNFPFTRSFMLRTQDIRKKQTL